MPFHITALGGLAGISLLLAIPLYYLLLQPRSVLIYFGLATAASLEWLALVLVYRLGLHPLAKYPGPLLAAITDWYVVFWIADGGRHLELHRQHQRYGKYVRYGPNRLSINSAKASRDLHDVKSNTFKADTYSAFKRFFGAEGSLTTVNHKEHAFRRRVNMRAITPTAVGEFEGLVTPHVDEFIRIIGQGAGLKSDGDIGWSPGKDMSHAAAYCIADIMGSVTFGRTWNVQREARYRRQVKDLPKGVAGIHLVGHMQSLFLFDFHKLLFKELIQGANQLMRISRSFALWRLEQESMPHPDIWAAVLASSDPKTGVSFTKEELISEASLFVIGGTDGMITGVTSTLFYLLHNPHTLQRLTREIRDAFPLPTDPTTKRASEIVCPIRFASKSLQEITYLPACIDEAMRISPPVPGLLPRVTGPGGLIVDGEFFPGGVNLAIPHYSLQRSEDHFPQSSRYRPERWIPEDRAFNSALRGCGADAMQPAAGQAPAFTPFGAGRSSCIGKYLAYQEMSIILARMAWTFDMQLDPGSTLGKGTGKGDWGRGREDEFQLYDRFVSAQDGPVVQFRYREELII